MFLDFYMVFQITDKIVNDIYAHGHLEMDGDIILGDIPSQGRCPWDAYKARRVAHWFWTLGSSYIKIKMILFLNLKYIIHIPWDHWPLKCMHDENLTGFDV